MVKISEVQPKYTFIKSGKNVVKNIAHYTYNVVPRTQDAIQIGKQIGIEKSKKKNLGKFSACLTKNYYITKNILNSVNVYEIPLLMSAIAFPITPPGGQPLVLAAGCILISPIVLKNILLKKTSVKEIVNYIKHLKEPDFIKLNKKVYKTD